MADDYIWDLGHLTSFSALRIPADDGTNPALPITGHVVPDDILMLQDSGGSITRRHKLNLIGGTYADNPGADSMDFTFGGGGSSSYVEKSLYNAQTILAATADDTPAAVTVNEQTLVGRITSGNIASLTVAQIQTLAFSAAVPENVGFLIDPALSADGKYSGLLETGVAGSALSFGQSIYWQPSDARWELTNASASPGAMGKLGICVQAAAADGNATTALLIGKVRADALFPSLSTGSPVYLSTSAGGITNTAPSSAGNIARIIGYGNDGNELYFFPDNTFLERA
jgi:hypothetical protein